VNVRRGGLGRGLGALIPTGPKVESDPSLSDGPVLSDGPHDRPPADSSAGGTDPGVAPGTGAEGLSAHFDELPIGAITPNPRQPRQVFEEDALAELVLSIREVGLLQPIVVRPVGEATYELVMGERRWRASQAAGLTTIPAIVRDTGDDAMLRDALLENLHRSQLNPLEEAAAYDQLLADFSCTHEELARRIGRSRPQISNTLRLLKLPAPVQRRVAAGVLSAGHARALLGLDDPQAQELIAHRIVAEGLSVRAVEEIVALGGPDPAPEPRRQVRRPTAPGLVDLSERLSDRLETRVRIQMGKTRGKVMIEFATLDDLDRIVGAIEGRASRSEAIQAGFDDD
jgi:ParB family chromosome partitioning protein